LNDSITARATAQKPSPSRRAKKRPDRIARETTDLYRYVSKPISTPIVFALSDDGAKPVVGQTLAPSFNVGIHLVRLADFGVRLAPGKQYRCGREKGAG
jgi:hypothetical protein